MELAARYLATRPRSRWEVERRLRRAGAEPAVIEATLARMAELGFVDDRAFARWWLEQRDRHAPRGRRMLEAELRQHGVGRDVIAVLREELAAAEGEAATAGGGGAGAPGATWEGPLDDRELPQTEDDRARIALQQHLRGRPVPGGRQARQRLGMYLVRRGFGPDTARAAIRDAAGSDDEPEAESTDQG
jgi:SOS response regulatory protein OraA/RecX